MKHSGAGGDRLLSQITGLDEKTIQRGRQELAGGLADQPADRVRQPGGGRHPMEKNPAILSALTKLVEPETAGDPMSAQKWVRSRLCTLSQRLKDLGHAASPPTVGRPLGALKYSLRVNAKQREARSAHPDR